MLVIIHLNVNQMTYNLLVPLLNFKYWRFTVSAAFIEF